MIETIKIYQGQDVGASQCLVTLESFIGDTNEQELDDGTVLDASDAVTAINGLIWSLERRETEIERLRAALTPSAETKAAYIGEFTMDLRQLDEFGVEQTARITIPWTSVKEIMRAIQKYADEQDANK